MFISDTTILVVTTKITDTFFLDDGEKRTQHKRDVDPNFRTFTFSNAEFQETPSAKKFLSEGRPILCTLIRVWRGSRSLPRSFCATHTSGMCILASYF